MTSKERCEALMEYIVEENQGYFDKERICNVLTAILKDLELLEKYKKVMCEPILDIIKKLKLLYILRENIKLIDYCIYNDKIVIYLPVYYRDALKEWLEK